MRKPDVESERRSGIDITGIDHVQMLMLFVAAPRAHPCLIVADLTAGRRTIVAAGTPVIEDDTILGVARCYTTDPFGNRIELIDASDAGFTSA